MKFKLAWAFQSLFLVILFNFAFGAIIFLMSERILDGLSQWVTPFVGPNSPTGLPDGIQTAFSNFSAFLVEMRQYMLPSLAALTTAITLLLWFFVFLAGGRQIRRAGEHARSSCQKATEGQETI